MQSNGQPPSRPHHQVLLALLLVDVGKEERQQEGSCQEDGRRHIDVNQQVTAPTPDATSVENSRDLQRYPSAYPARFRGGQRLPRLRKKGKNRPDLR